MASPGFSPISEDGEVGEAPHESTPSFPPSAFAAVAAAAAALSAPTLPVTEEADSSQSAEIRSSSCIDYQSLETGAVEPGGGAWAPPGTVLLLPATVGSPAVAQVGEHSEAETARTSRRSSDSFCMEVDAGTPVRVESTPANQPFQQTPHHIHPQDGNGTPFGVSFSSNQPSATDGLAVSPPPPVAGSRQQQQAVSGFAAGFSTERIAAVLATVDSRQASVETTANLIYRFAAAVPPPHVAAAAAEAATHAAGAASRKAAAAAAASSGSPPSPVALRALARTAGANAAAAAAATVGALPLSIAYLLLDSYRRSQPKHRLAIFYVFHRLIHLSCTARGNAEAAVPPGSIEDAGYSVFVLPVVQELSHPEMDSVRHKMLRCISIWRDWRVYTPAALSHIRQLAAQGASCRASDREEGAAAEAWAALLQLQTLRFLAQTPSGRKAYAYARLCFDLICGESPPGGGEASREAREDAADVSSSSLPILEAAAAHATGNGDEGSAQKRQKGLIGIRPEIAPGSFSRMPQTSENEVEVEEVEFISKEFGIPTLRRLNDEQLIACSKLFDRASRVTGQEYLLLQSSLMDLSGLLQMQHQHLLELREEMQQFASAATVEAGSGPPPNGQQPRENALI